MNKINENLKICGLKNIGNTCYINSCLQMLVNLNELNEYLDNIDIQKLNDNIDSIILKEYNDLRIMMNSNNSLIIPIRFIKIMKNIAEKKNLMLFTDYSQNDAIEFLLFLLDSFHNSLKKKVNINITGNEKSNKDKLAIECYKMIKKQYTNDYSEIINLFYGISVTLIQNIENNEILSYKCESFSILYLPIYDDNINNIYDCFEKLIEKEFLKNENAWYNDKLKIKQNVKKFTKFWSFPKILIITFNKFTNTNIKFEKFISANDNIIDLSKYVIGYNSESYKYYLKSTIQHIGGTQGGHYMCNLEKNNEWYNLDDETINKINNNIVNKNTYCLIYEKIK